MSVIRGTRYKYIQFAALPPVLFDLAIDPEEFHNRADDPDYRSVMLRYTQKMLNWRMNDDERVLTNFKLTPDGGWIHRSRPQ